MSLKVETYYSGAWADISDYVIGANDAPFNSRNRDYSLRAEGINLEIAGTIRDVRGASYEFPANHLVRIYSDTTPLFSGYVDTSQWDNDTYSFNLTVKNMLEKLHDFEVDSNTIYSTISAGTNWWEYTNEATQYYGAMFDGGVVGITWLLKCLFNIAGLALDTSAIDDTTIFTAPQTTQGHFAGGVAIKYKHLFMHETFVYCTNQSKCTNYIADDDAQASFNDSKVDFFEFSSETMKVLASLDSVLILKLESVNDTTGLTTYKIITASESITISNDDRYADQQVKEKAENNDPTNIGVVYTETYHLFQGSDYTVTLNPLGKGSEIKIWNNFEILISDAPGLTNHYADQYAFMRLGLHVSDTALSSQSVYIVYGISGGLLQKYLETYYLPNILKLRYRSLGLDYQSRETTTSLWVTNSAVVENMIDLENRTSTITQETY